MKQTMIAGMTSLLTLLLCWSNASAASSCDDFQDALKALQQIKTQGEGNDSAVQAMQVLNQATAEQIPAMLVAMKGAGKIAQNWFRGAINRAAQQGGPLPKKQIQAVFDDPSNDPMGRLLAFELLTRGDQSLREKMLAGLADDPSLPLRFMGVASLIEAAEQSMEDAPGDAKAMLMNALEKARDIGQVQKIAENAKKLGAEVDLQKQLGFVGQWKLVGCFDNKDEKGFDVPYGPEKELKQLDPNASYTDQDGKTTTWQDAKTEDPMGNVDLNEVIGKVKGATVYAMTTFSAREARQAQFRIGTANATKIWLNGNLVMANEIYHNSNSPDKFIGDVQLNAGENTILIKVCQNEQTQPWAQDWQFQFRICDQTGKAILPAAR